MVRFDCKAIITETVKQIKNAKTNEVDKRKCQFIFDIDVFKKAEYKPESDEIWEVFDVLRAAKNQIFFESLTDKAKELFR